MSNKVTLELEGVNEILDKLKMLDQRMQNKAIKEALELAAVPIADDAVKTNSFTDRTGKLRDAIKVGDIKTSNGVKYILIGVGKSDRSKAFYGKFLEWGTSKMSARPFMGPAYLANKDEAKAIIKATLGRYLK